MTFPGDIRLSRWTARLRSREGVSGSLRLRHGYGELGEPVAGEAGLLWARGWSTTLEAGLEWSAGPWWAGLTPRVQRSWTGQDGAPPVAWDGWRPPTGRALAATARRLGADTEFELVRAVAGRRLGRWSASLGWDVRRTGPGLTGGALLDASGAPFAAATLRRTEPFRWYGIMRPLAPERLLMRGGLLSRRTVRYRDIAGDVHREQRPWFCQWLVGWRPTAWSRVAFSHTVMAATREGTLWPDLLQLNLPLVGTTWREMDSGPITDRLFAAQMEVRWRRSPWPLLPARAGRLYWEYAGTDFLPSGPFGLLPEISIPASVLGCELIGEHYDLSVEYAEFEHELGLWYSNSGFPEGYTHDGHLLGHPLGGTGEAWTGAARWRRPGAETAVALRARRSTWGSARHTAETGREWLVAVSLEGAPGGRHGSLVVEWRRTELAPHDGAAATEELDWWRAWVELRLP